MHRQLAAPEQSKQKGCSSGLTSMADTSVVDLNSDLMGLRRSDLNCLDGERLSSFPGDAGLMSRQSCQYLCNRQVFLAELDGEPNNNRATSIKLSTTSH